MVLRWPILLALAIVVPALGWSPASAAGTSFAWGSDRSQWESYQDATRAATIAAAKAGGMTLLGTDADDAGSIGWATSAYPTFTTMKAGDGAVERMTRDAHVQGIRVMARFDVFLDHVAASRYPGSVIGGSPAWVDPACADVRAFEIAQVKDLVSKVAIDEINFDHVRYPDSSEVPLSTRLPCTGSTLGDVSHAQRGAIVASWVKDAAAAAKSVRPGIVVSADVFPLTMNSPDAARGQDAAKLAPYVDVLRPMIYPSYFSSTAEGQPYATAKQYTLAGVQKYGAAKIQPWVQGFGPYAKRSDLICQQIQGAVDAGATGAMVWWFEDTGTSTTFWSAVGACVPSAPSPPSGSFSATFTPKPGNSYWVETKVNASAALAGVSARVNGGASVALAKTSWGTWAKSFYVPTGALVRFTATSTTGASVTSGNYSWPTAQLATSTPPPSTSNFTATFTKGGANTYWVEVKVSANQPVAAVAARVNGGSPVALAKTGWGSWAKSFYVAPGSKVVFVATSGSGASATSAPFSWP